MASVDHESVDLANAKIQNGVKQKRKISRKRIWSKGRCRASCLCQNRDLLPAVVAELRAQAWAAWWLSSFGSRGR